jgi:hypothetical protein
VTPTPPAETGKRKLTLDPGVAVVIAALIGVAGVVAGAFIGPHVTASKSTAGPVASRSRPAGTPSLRASKIVIQTPRSGDKVKQCPQIGGAGHIPAGYGLWIVVVPDISQQPRQYWIESSAAPDGPDHWSATSSVSIGAPATSKTNAYIYAILISQQWSSYLAHSTVEGNFWAKSLPPTIAVAGPVTVTRTAGAGFCH